MPKLILPKPKKKLTTGLTAKSQADLQYEKNPWIGLPADWANHLGFVYYIECLANGRWYVGKKLFYAAAARRGRTNRIKESDWRTYWGSCKELVADMQKYGKEGFRRTILSVWDTKFDLMYYELFTQIEYDVVHDPKSYNGVLNIRSYIPHYKRDPKDPRNQKPSGSLPSPE